MCMQLPRTMMSPPINTAAPAPSPAARARLSHLRHYANISHLAAHKSSTFNDPTIRLPRADAAAAAAAAQEAHEENVRKEIEGLSKRIRVEREALGRLPQKTPKSNISEKRTRLNGLLIDEQVYGKKLHEELPPPGAPEPTSPLNPLLLHRFLSTEIERLVSTSIPHARREISEVKSQIRTEQEELQSTELLTSALRRRVETLEREVGLRKSQGADGDDNDDVEIADKIIKELEDIYTLYTKSQRKFLRELSKFVNTHLAKLLAAESLGGPIVGEDLDIEVTTTTKFDKTGKVRREKEKGQRTIHDMFSVHKGKKRGHGDCEDEEAEAEREEVLEPNVKAARELKGLLEDLMNKAMEAEGYVVLQGGDSAAARFLVRSRVAVFHPKDARRVRLVEFGRSVED